jgi:hypothetical protein
MNRNNKYYIELLTHPVVLECIDRGLILEVTKDYVSIPGFYKSDCVKLYLGLTDDLIAIARYDERTIIKSFKDLVELNYQWWKNSENRSQAWKSPDDRWADFMVEFGLVMKSVLQIIQYKDTNK